MAARALIQGSSRGIGLEYCRMILSRSHDAKVIATCRSPDNAKELQNLSSEMSGRLCILPLDVTKENDIQVFFCTCCMKETVDILVWFESAEQIELKVNALYSYIKKRTYI